MKNISVILATYNECDFIQPLIEELYKKIPKNLEVIVVDDNSTDGTAEIVKKLQYENLVLIERKKRGLASAFHRGIIESSGEILCWMDADMTMPVDTLVKLIATLDKADIAVGSRYAKGGSDNRAPIRTLSSKIINSFANIVLGGGIKDYDSGFVAIKKDVFNYITIMPYGYGDYFIEFIFDAYKAGLNIEEVGYAFRDRTKGVSKSLPNISSFLYTGSKYIIRILKIKILSIIRSLSN